MEKLFWGILILVYGVFSYLEEKRNDAKAVLCFFNGAYLAFLCFLLLPACMEQGEFLFTAGAAGGGILFALLLEKQKYLPLVIFAVVTGVWVLMQDIFFTVLAFFGGMGLYHASAGVIPEKIEMLRAMLSVAGFLLGTILFSCF